MLAFGSIAVRAKATPGGFPRLADQEGKKGCPIGQPFAIFSVRITGPDSRRIVAQAPVTTSRKT